MCIHVYIHIYIYIQYIILYDVISLHYCIIHEGSVEYTIEHVLSEISNPRKPYPSVVHTGTGTLRPVIVSLDPRIPTDSANLSLQRYSTMTDESGPSPGRFEQSKGMLCISCVAVLKLWIHRGRSAHRLSVAILGSKPVWVPANSTYCGIQMRSWRNTVGRLIDVCWLKKSYRGTQFDGIWVNNGGVRFHRIRDFKQYNFNSIPPAPQQNEDQDNNQATNNNSTKTIT